MFKKATLAAALALVGGGYGMAQTATKEAVIGAGAGPSQALRAKSILGSSVALEGGTAVGTVYDIVLNEDGVVDYVVVAEGTKLVTVPWEATKFNFEKRTAVINVPAEKFREIPTFTADRYPNFYAPEYRVQVYRHYGITPGRERRLERRDERRP